MINVVKSVWKNIVTEDWSTIFKIILRALGFFTAFAVGAVIGGFLGGIPHAIGGGVVSAIAYSIGIK